MHKIKRVTVDDWQKLKETRLRAVTDSPDAFGDSAKKVAAQSDSYWIEGITKSYVFAIEQEGQFVAMVVFSQDDDGVWALNLCGPNRNPEDRDMRQRLYRMLSSSQKKRGYQSLS